MLEELYQLVQRMERGTYKAGLVEQSEVVERLTDLFDQKAKRLPQDRAAIFDHLFLNLSDGIDARTRNKLAQTLSMHSRSPPRIVEKFANDDDIAVAGPILSSGLDIPEAVLAAVANEKGEKHLRALAQKKGLLPSVTTPIAKRGADGTLVVLAANTTARFDAEGFGHIADRARSNPMLRNVVCARADTPERDFTSLMALDRDFVCCDFDAECYIPGLAGIDVVNVVVAALRDAPSAQFSPSMMRASFDYVAMKAIKHSLKQADFERWTRRRQFEDAIAGLAIVSAIPPEYIERLISVPSAVPAAIVFRAVGFDWAAMKSFMQARKGAEFSMELPGEIYELFSSIEVDTARRVIRHAALHKQIVAFPASLDQ
jgi:hypothetical protein